MNYLDCRSWYEDRHEQGDPFAVNKHINGINTAVVTAFINVRSKAIRSVFDSENLLSVH